MSGEGPSRAERRWILHRTMTLLWCFPSLGGVAILFLGHGFRFQRLEDLVAIGILAVHLLFAIGMYRWRWAAGGGTRRSCPSTNTN